VSKFFLDFVDAHTELKNTPRTDFDSLKEKAEYWESVDEKRKILDKNTIKIFKGFDKAIRTAKITANRKLISAKLN
jgi:hypothetical protein